MFRLKIFASIALILSLAYFTYFRNYSYPPGMFWDENYRLTSAFQYLNGVMFMEYHPPLGKLFIALGEFLFQPNKRLDTKYFLSTDYIKFVPAGFSFVGVRFFPVLVSTLSAALFFLILYQISRNLFLSLIFSSLYLFDNALIVHSRGANIDSVQVFFALAAILYFLVSLNSKISILRYLILGLLIGAIIAVKLDGFLFLTLLIVLLVYENIKRKLYFYESFFKSIAFLFGVVVVFCGSYYIHGLLGQKVIQDRYFNASPEYRYFIESGRTADPRNLPVIIRDNLFFSAQYGSGIPKYDPSFEIKYGNASLPITWPLGDKAINYRWEKVPTGIRYLYLQANPLIWLSGLVGVMLSIILTLSVLVFHLSIKNKRLFLLQGFFLSLYLIFMISLISLDRVLFLYTYFIPLLLSLILFFIIYLYLFEEAIKRKDKRLYVGTALFVLSVIGVYLYFSPLTYFQPLTLAEFQKRAWFTFWHLTPVL